MRIGSSVGTMKIGSTAVAAIKRGTDRVYDADVAAFQKASAAADVSGIMDLVDYLKAESLWNYARFYPMKSSQNAGTGSTVYGLGGLTSNNMTLVNSPTWGSDGVTFDGSTQYGSIQNLWSSSGLFMLTRAALGAAGASADSTILGNWDSSVDQRGLLYLVIGTGPGDRFGVGVSSDGTAATVWGQQATDGVFTTDSQTFGFNVSSSAVFSMFQEKASLARTTWIGSQQASLYAANSTLYYAANRLSGGSANLHTPMQSTALFLVSGADPTTTQRETITDLINAL